MTFVVSLAERFNYFTEAAVKRARGVGMRCPNCGSAEHETVDRKRLVTELRRCAGCRLLYRAPTDSREENRKFYQAAYRQGMTTEMPSDDQLEQWKRTGFAGTSHDYRAIVELLRSLSLPGGAKVFDFGCSWGYGSWQLVQAGFDVTSYEISRSRAGFAMEKLGIRLVEREPAPASPGDLASSFDVFFSSHVVEHVPKPSAVVELAEALLKPGGYFIAFTPNGSDDYRRVEPDAWHRLWGKVHPNFIDQEFWRRALSGRELFLGTTPVLHEDLRRFAAGESPSRPPVLDGSELVCIARV